MNPTSASKHHGLTSAAACILTREAIGMTYSGQLVAVGTHGPTKNYLKSEHNLLSTGWMVLVPTNGPVTQDLSNSANTNTKQLQFLLLLSCRHNGGVHG